VASAVGGSEGALGCTCHRLNVKGKGLEGSYAPTRATPLCRLEPLCFGVSASRPPGVQSEGATVEHCAKLLNSDWNGTVKTKCECTFRWPALSPLRSILLSGRCPDS